MKDPSKWLYSPDKPGILGDKDIDQHKNERIQNGFSVFDWLNFNAYLSWVIHQGLLKFRKEGNGYPAHLTEETWNFMLDEMIDGFEAFYELESMDTWNTEVSYDEWAEPLLARWKVGKQLFIDNFENLWD